jgi:hypothetical protein
MESRFILFNLASRSRPERCARAIRSIRDNARGNYLIRLVLDQDDAKLYQYLTNKDIVASSVIGYSNDKIDAINRGPVGMKFDILVNTSDDIIFTAPGFDDIIRQHCGPDDFCLFPEPFADNQARLHRNERISIVSIMGADYYKRDGYIYHPSYKRTHCDNEATEVARRRGRLKEVEIPIFYHEHPAAGFPVSDDQYKLERETWAADSANYRARKEAGFP